MRKEEKIFDALTKTLANEQPTKRARDLLPETRRGASKKHLIAAGIILCMLISSFTVPTVARALGEIPLLGESYTEFLAGTGLGVAYQAGLVNGLNYSDTNGDITFRILAAYSDATQTVITYKISSEDPSKIQELWESSYSHFPNVFGTGRITRFSVAKAGSGHGQLTDEGEIYGMWEGEALGWRPFGHKFTAQLNHLDLSVTFPVQTIPSDLNKTLIIDETFVYNGITITFEEITFSPSATQVSYNIDGLYYNQSLHTHLRWSLRDQEGEEFQTLGGRLSGKNGVMNYLPIDSEEIVIVFEGYETVYYLAQTLPLEIGSKYELELGTLSIQEIVSTDVGTDLYLAWEGDSTLEKPGVCLLINKQPVEATEGSITDAGFMLSFQHGKSLTPDSLAIEQLHISVREDIEVARVQREQ